MKTINFILITLCCLVFINKNAFNQTPVVENIDLIPQLDITHFENYAVNAAINPEGATINAVKLVVTPQNGQTDEDNWDFYTDGTPYPNPNIPLEYVMTKQQDLNIWTYEGLRPDDIYPEIFFAHGGVTNYAEPSETIITSNAYQIMHFQNPFTLGANTSFFIEFYTTPVSLSGPPSMDIQVYLVGREKTVNFFAGAWRGHADVEMVGTVNRYEEFHHQHSDYSKHHLIPLSTNADGTIGNKSINITDDFWLVLYIPTHLTTRGWYLKYHETCNNNNTWFTGSDGITPSGQTGCPDVHVHIARNSEPIIDGAKLEVVVEYQTGEVNDIKYYYFGQIPNLAPNASSFTEPAPGTYSETVTISWNQATDPNNDAISYKVKLLDPLTREILYIITENHPGTSYDFNTFMVPNGDYDIQVEACDEEYCTGFFWSSNVGENDVFRIENDIYWKGGHISSETMWNVAENWNPERIPTETDNVILPETIHKPSLSGINPIIKSLKIEAGASLGIGTDASLSVLTDTFENNAGAGGLIIQSDATGTGSLIHHTAGVDATVERYIAHWTDDMPDHGWHFLSSPVATQPIRPEFVPTTNPIPVYIDFYKWEESGQIWINVKNTSGNWNTSFEDNFAIGRGYLLAYGTPPKKSYGNKAHQFIGKINVSDVSLTGLSNSGGEHDGWHLIGNPFSSAIKFNQGSWNKTNIGAYAQIWDEANASYKVLSGSQIIPAHNGFMVYTTGSGSLTIPIDARLHSDSSWYKTTEQDDLLVLTVKDPARQTAQETIISFDHNATAGFDLAYDSYFMAGFAPMFYSISENEFYVLNTLPELSHGLTIPLGFVKTQSKDFNIALTQSMPDVIVYLVDLKTNTTRNLTQNYIYNFTAESGDDPNRFLLKFETVGINELPESNMMHAYTYGNTLCVMNQHENALVEVYNVQGQMVLSNEITQGMQRMKAGLAPGTYVVRVTSDIEVYIRKVVIQ